MFKASKLWQLLRQAGRDWMSNNAPQLGAALAFYTALSLTPLVVILLSVSGMIFGADAARGQVSHELQRFIDPGASRAVEDIIAGASRRYAGTTGAAISLAILMYGASAAFSQLQAALNKIWRVERTGRGLVRLVRDKFFTFLTVMAIALLLVASVFASTMLASLGAMVEDTSPRFSGASQSIDFAASLVLMTILFAVVFKLLPDAKITWRDVWVGAAVTACLFTAGKSAIGLYLSHSNMFVSYGVANSFVALLVWVYYSAQIVLFGAELTHVYAVEREAGAEPGVSPRSVTGG